MRSRCIICGKFKYNGIIICGEKICKTCEERAMRYKNCTDFYSYYINCLKHKLSQLIIKKGEG